MQATHFQCCHNHSKSICFQETVSTISGTNIHYLLDSCHVTVGSSHGWGLLILVTTRPGLQALRLMKVKIKYFLFVI